MTSLKSAYILLDTKINDPIAFEDYKAAAKPIVEKFGGKYLIRGGAFDIVEGEWPAERTTVVEFENFEKAKEFYNSLEYNEAKNVRQKSADTDFILIEGY